MALVYKPKRNQATLFVLPTDSSLLADSLTEERRNGTGVDRVVLPKSGLGFLMAEEGSGLDELRSLSIVFFRESSVHSIGRARGMGSGEQ